MNQNCSTALRFGTLSLAMLLLATSPSFLSVALAGCDGAKAITLNESPLPEKPDQEIDVTKVESAEGGSFEIYLNAARKPERIIRTDYGETGRWVTSLILGSATDVMITRTAILYSVPITEPGSFTIRSETDFYHFCDGKLDPETDPTSNYAKAARDAAESIVSQPEMQPLIAASAMRPLLLR